MAWENPRFFDLVAIGPDLETCARLLAEHGEIDTQQLLGHVRWPDRELRSLVVETLALLHLAVVERDGRRYRAVWTGRRLDADLDVLDREWTALDRMVEPDDETDAEYFARMRTRAIARADAREARAPQRGHP